MISGIIFVIRNGLRWRDAPKDYSPHKTIYNRFIRWSRLGVLNKIFAALAAKGGSPDRLMNDATHLKAHKDRRQSAQKWAVSRHIGRIKGGLNSKLHAVCDGWGTAADHAAQRRPDERLQRCGLDARCPAAGQGDARRPWL